jgi:hypothetical protein
MAQLHPNGRCRCFGEGTCEWCRATAAEERVRELERERDGLARDAAGYKQLYSGALETLVSEQRRARELERMNQDQRHAIEASVADCNAATARTTRLEAALRDIVEIAVQEGADTGSTAAGRIERSARRALTSTTGEPAK